MSKDGWLPPGVEHNMIPGDRPEDVAWEAAAESVSAYDVLEACKKVRGYACIHADWLECPECSGTGLSPEGTDCNKCEGNGDIFNGCDARIIDKDDSVNESADWSECSEWTTIVEGRMNP